MKDRPMPRALSPAVVAIAAVAVAALAAPVPASAQCMTLVPPVCSMGMCTAHVVATPVGRSIYPLAWNQVGPGRDPNTWSYISMGVPSARIIMVTKTGAATSPSATWACTSGFVPTFFITINASDGLPVELMEFSVETEEVAKAKPSQSDADEKPETKAKS